MTCTKVKSKRRLSAKFAAGLAVSAFLLLGMHVAPARAENDNGRNWAGSTGAYGQYYGQPSYGYGQQQYYRQPAYGYGQPYYGQRSYSPGVGIYVPGIGIRIQ